MTTSDTAEPTLVPLGRDYPEIREGVRAICARYPDKYWRELEDKDEYADAFVAELSAAGYLGALIPERYGGAGLPVRAGCVILEEIHATGCSAAPCRAQMYMMGTLLRHRSEEHTSELQSLRHLVCRLLLEKKKKKKKIRLI